MPHPAVQVVVCGEEEAQLAWISLGCSGLPELAQTGPMGEVSEVRRTVSEEEEQLVSSETLQLPWVLQVV